MQCVLKNAEHRAQILFCAALVAGEVENEAFAAYSGDAPCEHCARSKAETVMQHRLWNGRYLSRDNVARSLGGDVALAEAGSAC